MANACTANKKCPEVATCYWLKSGIMSDYIDVSSTLPSKLNDKNFNKRTSQNFPDTYIAYTSDIASHKVT